MTNFLISKEGKVIEKLHSLWLSIKNVNFRDQSGQIFVTQYTTNMFPRKNDTFCVTDFFFLNFPK
jgi:hypothetical protein